MFSDCEYCDDTCFLGPGISMDSIVNIPKRDKNQKGYRVEEVNVRNNDISNR